MPKRRHRSANDPSRRDSYVYRPPQPWFQRVLDVATSPAGLGGLTGAFLGLVIALLAVDIDVRLAEPGLKTLQIRLRPGEMTVYRQQGTPAEMESLAKMVRLLSAGVPVALGAAGAFIGRRLTPPRVEEVFEQPR